MCAVGPIHCFCNKKVRRSRPSGKRSKWWFHRISARVVETSRRGSLETVPSEGRPWWATGRQVLTAAAIMFSKADEWGNKEREASNWVNRSPRVSRFDKIEVFKASRIVSKSLRADAPGLLTLLEIELNKEKRSLESKNLIHGRAKVVLSQI